ncbi:outer membrane protein assembly factor BamC [Mycoavidus sp. HKI]|uniref:outer membrane protein assembly factor BamC n=1 Tax=Mycoavidus sp. HKI TaxID=2840467 RepID=UPI001CC12753|nr:outer membrane protein assembly factor BamC [Mycoavidus sp. HKI]UAW65003.2 outer membrane protein assembly factor BamC [Mycoavidus sp. HKI]
MIQSTMMLRAMTRSIFVLAIAGCSSPNPNAIDYQGATKSKSTPLVVPPDMAYATTQQRTPGPDGTVSLSSYLRPEPVMVPLERALEPIVGMHIERQGSMRWLIVEQQTPQQLWPQIRQFWQEQGFSLTLDAPERGVMETDWKETYTNIDQGIIRNTLAKAFSHAYVTGEKNQYRLRLESRPQGGSTILLSQKGMREVLVGRHKEMSQWQSAPHDPVLEAEYLQRLMLALGPNKSSQAPTVTGVALSTAALASPAQQSAPAPVSLTQIDFAEPFDRVWLYIGYTLERGNFSVAQGNRAQGMYTVRYVEPTAAAAEPSFWSQVFRGKKEKVVKQYKLRVRAMTQTTTRVAVVNDDGEMDVSPSAQRILSLLADQLR